MSFTSRLKKAFKNAPVRPLTSCSRFCIISDCHRGDGTSNDNFLKNQNLYLTALKHYYACGFTYIELGDGDELWENRHMEQITEIHSNVFRLLSLFYRQGRLYLLYGNHDMEKKSPCYAGRFCRNFFCTDTHCRQALFPELVFHESLILEDPYGKYRIYLTHGHQADFWNSSGWKVNRFLVRYIWRPLERFGMLDPTSAAKNYRHKDKIEKRLSTFAAETGFPLITGHTHRPRMDASDLTYMNTGSCVHPHCITCIEIEGKHLTLVKWTYDTREDRTLFVSREVLSRAELL